jgi:Tripartite tricarboxylate transporter family receptor
MARRSAQPPKPKSPNLTVGQKRRRIERLQKCVASLEACDPQKARKRAPAVLELNREINVALSDPKMKARLADLGGTALVGSPADFGKLIVSDTEKWAKVIRAAHIKAD